MDQGAKDFVAGVVAGVALVGVGHPFDTVKVKLQAQQASGTGARYQGALHCGADILRTEGVRGLYKGVSSSLIGVAVESSLLFGTYSQLKKALQGPDHQGAPSVTTTAAAAAVAGGLVSVVLCPTELVKCRLQVQGGSPATNPAHAPQAVVTSTHAQIAAADRARAAATSTPVAVLASSGPRAHSTLSSAQGEGLLAGERRAAQGSPQARLKDAAALPQGTHWTAVQASQPGAGPLAGPLPEQRSLPRVLGRCSGPGFGNIIPLGARLGAAQWPLPGHGFTGSAGAAGMRQGLHSLRPPVTVRLSHYDGPWDCIKRTVQLEGPGALFKGLTATALRESIGNVCFFLTYESVKRHLTVALAPWASQVGRGTECMRPNDSPSAEGQSAGLEGPAKGNSIGRIALVEALTGLLSGGCAGVAFWCAVLPLDVVKTQIQTGTGSLGSQAGVLSHLLQLQRQNGLRSLYAGLGPTLWRAFPANAAAVVTWELTTRFLGAWGSKS